MTPRDLEREETMKPARILVVAGLVLALSLGISTQAVAVKLSDASGHKIADTVHRLLTGSNYTESVDMSFDVRAGGALLLGTTNGSINVRTWEKEQIRLVITKTAKAASAFDAKALLAKFLVQTKQVGRDLHLQAKAQTAECKETVGVTFDVWVPRSYNVDIKTETGSIDIGRLNGKFSAHTNDGNITLGYDPDDGLDIRVEDHTAESSGGDKASDVSGAAPAAEEVDSQDTQDEKPAKTTNKPITKKDHRFQG